MPTGVPNKSAGQTLSASEFNDVNDLVNANEANIATNTSSISGKADASHTHTANQITDFQTEVSQNSDVQSNSSDRHTHANKALLDGYTQTNAAISSAISESHSQNTDTALDQGGGDETTANEIRTHIDDDDIHTTEAEIDTKDGMPIVTVNDVDFGFIQATHTNSVLKCNTPTANRNITITSGNLDRDNTFKILATTDSGFEYRLVGNATTLRDPSDGSTITSPMSLEDGLYFVHYDDSAAEAWVMKYGTGSGSGTSGPMSTFRAKKSGTQAVTTAGGWGDVTLWTEDAMSDNVAFSFNATTGELTSNVTAPILFLLDANYFDTANNRVEGWVGLSINTGSGHTLEDEYTHAFYASRNSTAPDQGGGGAAMLVDVTAGHKFKMRVKVEGANSEIRSDFVRFQAIALTGAVGPAGPAGGNEKLDGSFRIQNTLDNTKEVDFDVSGVPTGTKRTITLTEDANLDDIAQNKSDIAALGSGYDGGAYSNITPLGSGWSGQLRSRKDSNGVVYVDASLLAGITGTPGTLDVGSRPSATISRHATNQTTNSVIIAYIYSNGNITLSGVDFSAFDTINMSFQFET